MEGTSKIVGLIARDENLHTAITQNIMKNWRDNPDEGFQDIVKDNEQKVYDMYRLAVANEKKWAEYLFSKGSLLGLNADMLGGYIEWLANNRLKSLGYDKIFDAPTNPIGGWLNSFTDSSKVQVAPQETEISSYKIGARDTEIDSSDFDEFEL
jgi:ribonucleoside-diphosphate reductase beta chain